MKVLIITGGSHGIGKAIAKKYTSEKYQVFSISRSIVSNVEYKQLQADLSNASNAIDAIHSIFALLDLKQTSSITLVHNAGRLGQINTLGNLDPENIEEIIQLNTTTPLILSNEFIKLTKHLQCKKQVISISSGAAENAYPGWSVYCTSKAGIEMMTKTIASEQHKHVRGVKAIAIRPGVVDTNMQTRIRKTPESAFKHVQRFIDLKQNNQLYSPQFVASQIYTIDNSNKLKNGDIIDLRTYA